MTDAEKVNAYLATIPGDEASDWFKIADAGRTLMRDLQNRGDGTVNAKSWGHLRNIAEAIKQLAFVLSSAECGDDPDIPF